MVSTTPATRTPAASDPGPLRPPWSARALIGAGLLVAAVAVTWLTFWWIGLSPASLAAGLDDTVRLLRRMWPPDLPGAGDVASMIAETLLIAVAGTGLAALASVPLAFVAARTHNGPRWLRPPARVVVVLTRAVPTLAFAILFVRIFGLGPLAGSLAVAVHSVGMIAKLLTDAVEETDPAPAEAVRACGAGEAQVAVSTVLPRVFPALTGIVLYRLDINIRASAVLGVVGAGGIGVALQTALGSLNYHRAAGIICVIVVLVLLLELLSVVVRRTVLRPTARRRTVRGRTARRRTDALPAGRAPYEVGWDRGRVLRVTGAVAAGVVFLVSLWSLDPDPGRLAGAWPNLRAVLSGMWPPAFSGELLMAVLESLLMALGAAAAGAACGLVLALLTAVNTTPWRPLSAVVRVLLVVVRGVPDLVYALLFVAALGLGPYAGFLALWISSTALAAKFFADSLEQLDPLPHEALTSVGARRWQAFAAGIWPQFVPSFTGNGLFVADLALRESVVLGIAGAGGVGYLMQESIATLRYDTTAAIVIAIAVVVYAIETLARIARGHLL
ncbi:phosphonate ABC transporter, permease protein PhnE [Microbispora sp. SCL1-1]|jgi:phosphonate transport system permease protein|uniref:Phosphonate ABC transporter, permease protein PhnE n=1 Tax=Microbispora hainanensis TaxID=568844 RepID=A0ABZ1SW21_9ACTN|nr:MULTISPECIES: phosphonate ABC transporter, permease protein PhnE [Microbispora]NJP29957.1 phosphonate ABC transporter, permease protein PhnE [Microbispora sp. CL1-1]TQS03505.1 phosphonate ABC transporter, permease protein PhnE [Microbispora sp. SCL1-1]